MKSMHFKALSSGHQNEEISVILSYFQKRAFYRSVHLCGKLHISIKWPDFNDLTEITDSNGISKENLPPVVVLVSNITKMSKMKRFQ